MKTAYVLHGLLNKPKSEPPPPKKKFVSSRNYNRGRRLNSWNLFQRGAFRAFFALLFGRMASGCNTILPRRPTLSQAEKVGWRRRRRKLHGRDRPIFLSVPRPLIFHVLLLSNSLSDLELSHVLLRKRFYPFSAEKKNSRREKGF